MEVTWHEAAGIVVISLWQGERCRSTFQLPIEEAAALVAVLTSALGDAIASAGSPRTPPRMTAGASSPSSSSSSSPSLLRLFHRLLSTRRAPVVPLRAVTARSGPASTR